MENSRKINSVEELGVTPNSGMFSLNSSGERRGSIKLPLNGSIGLEVRERRRSIKLPLNGFLALEVS